MPEFNDIYSYDFGNDYDPDQEDWEPTEDYDLANDDKAIEEWEASRPTMLSMDMGEIEPF